MDAGYAVMFSHSKEMKKNHEWVLSGFGGSFYGGDIKKLDLSFALNKNLNIQEARKLIIKGSQILIASMNNNEEIRQYLHHFPFDSTDLNYSIRFEENNYLFVSSEYVARVLVANGKVYYSVFNPKTDSLERIYEESYEEALEKVNNSNPD